MAGWILKHNRNNEYYLEPPYPHDNWASEWIRVEYGSNPKLADSPRIVLNNSNMQLYILLLGILAVILLLAFVLPRKEKYWQSTYVSTPRYSGVYPTWVTDWYWYDRYIRRPYGYVNYAAVPYFSGPYYPGPRRRWRRRWRGRRW